MDPVNRVHVNGKTYFIHSYSQYLLHKTLTGQINRNVFVFLTEQHYQH